MRSADRGFTLLEVMIALVFVGLALSAIGISLNKATDTSYKLRNQTLAMFIASNEIAELRVNASFPDIGRSTREVEFGDLEWIVVTVVQESGIEGLRRINVSVASPDNPDRIFRTITGFVGQAPASPSSAVPGFESLDSAAGEAS